MPSRQRKKRQAHKRACQKWRMRHPEKSATYRAEWEKRNPGYKAEWEKKNPAYRAEWEKRNPGNSAGRLKRWKAKNRKKVACSKMAWRQRNALRIRLKYQKWYQNNAGKKRAYRRQRYMAKLKQELKIRQQRYRIDLMLEKQYYRYKSVAMLRAGQTAAEAKFTRAVSRKLWSKEKRPMYQCMYDAKILVTKVMNARMKCVMFLKKGILCLQNQCEGFMKRAEEAGSERTLTDVCGTGMHCPGREPYFYDASYKIFSDRSQAIPLPDRKPAEKTDDEVPGGKRKKRGVERWPCDDNKCILPDTAETCISRLLSICTKLHDLKNFRRHLASGIDKCTHLKHPKKAETIGPEDIEKSGIIEYAVPFEYKLGHPISCLPNHCNGDMLFLRQMAVHYPCVFSLLEKIYEVQKYDSLLHEIDSALIKADIAALEMLVKMLSRKGSTDVAAEAVTYSETEETAEIRIKSLKYAVEFLKDIHEKPVYACASCRILHYRTEVRQVTFQEDDKTGAVKIYTGTSLKRKDAEKPCNDDLWMQLYGVVKIEKRDESKVFVCHSCFSSLTGGASHASKSIFNKLEVADTPAELADLNDFEKHFLQKAKCFQVIYRLGTVQSKLPAANRLKAHKGQVVHYPLPIDETLRTLPDPRSMPADQNLFIVVYGVPTKNKMVWKALVDVSRVKKAIEKLKQINPEYAGLAGDWEPMSSMEVTDDAHCDEEVLQECKRAAQKPMVKKIREDEEARIIDSYTVQPLFKKKPQGTDLELYQMQRVEAERIDPREAKLDLWCFPHLYPDGKNGEGEKRPLKLSNSDFINSRLYNEKPLFRHDHQYLFYLLHKYQMRALANAVSQTLRNTYAYNNVPVSEFVRRVQAGEQELEGNLYSMLKKMRGSAEYWAQQRLDLRTMVRELGAPTFFVTFSAAEYDWEDMQEMLIEVNKTVDGINDMSNGERCAMDPVMTSKHFHHRFRAVLKAILSKDGPLGEVEDFFWRVEYQARGACHFHMVFWVKGAPRIGNDPPEKVLEFIQKYATCRLPDKTKEPLLHKYVTRYQMHNCNNYCRKMRRKCRFGFPRKATEVAVLNDPLKNVGQRLRGKSESRLYYLPRKAEEARINDYNPELLLLWGANFDIQFVGEDTNAVVNYIVSYITKKEKSALQDLWDSVKKDQSVWSRLFNIGCRSLSMRECGAYEAADTVVGQRLFGKSRTVTYICARKPHLRPRLLKPLSALKEIEKNNPDSTEKYECNWITTYYPDRPDSLEDMCLKEFRRLHDRDSTWRKGPLAFKTKSNGTLVLRKKPYLISHPMYRFKDQPEEYCYSLLLLFKHFRNESEELIDSKSGSCIPVFESELLCNEELAKHHKERQENEEQAEKNKEAIEKERNAVTQPNEQRTPLETDAHVIGEPVEAANAMREFEVAMRNVAGESLEENVSKMNADQRRIFDHITSHLQSGLGQLLMFISGAGGTGKSFLINTLKLWAKQFYETEGTTIAVAAPTGLAAFNVNGMTLHRLLQLPVQHRSKTEYNPLSDDVCKELRQHLKHVRVLVIDEISMTSSVMLAYIHLRLNEIFNQGHEHILFGGLNVIVMGDLAQLPPCSDKPAFCPLTGAQANKMVGGWGAPDLWQNVFAYDELTINMRQKDDAEFAAILDNLRFGGLTEKDVAALQRCLITVPENRTPLQAFAQKYSEVRESGSEMVCLMSYQKMVEEFNNYMLQKETGGRIVEIPADDSFQFMGRPASKQQSEKAKEQLKKKDEKGNTETAGVEGSLRLRINARVMLRRNINVEKGLVNGAIGKVVGFSYKPGGKIVDKIHVKFDSIAGVESIDRVTAKFAQSKQLYVTRSQFPLILSYAMTIHKAQGLSLSHVMADVGNSIFTGDAGAGMTYVALSRVRTSAGLYLMNFDSSKAKANPKCVEEINRLRSIYMPHLSRLAVSKKKLKMVPDRPWCNFLKVPLQPIVTEDVLGKPQKRKRATGTKKANNARTAAEPVSKRKRANGAQTEAAPAAKSKNAPPRSDAAAKKAMPTCTKPKTVRKEREETFQTDAASKDAFSPDEFSPEMHAGALEVAQILKPPGLRNPCNVCYSNSVMQALMSLDSFREVCANLQHAAVKPFQQQLARFYLEYITEERRAIPAVLSTENLRLALAAKGFPFVDPTQQQCAREFFTAVFQKAKILHMFNLKSRSKYVCERSACRGQEWFSTDVETTSYLLLHPLANRTLEQLTAAMKAEKEKVCPKCGQKGMVKAGCEILSVPDQLLVWIWRYQAGDVDLAAVASFDPNHVSIGGNAYFVVAAVEHIGLSAESGHYIAYARRGDAWWQCDDSKVSKESGLPPGLKTISFLVLQRKATAAAAVSISID